jgi:hypothetical protein
MNFHKFFLPVTLMAALATFFHGCGYSTQTLNKTGVHKLFVPVFKSNVMEPNLGVLVTDNIVKAFQTDGSIQITDQEDSDATLKATITQFDLSPARFRVENERTVREYFLTMAIEYRAVKKGETKPYNQGKVIATTSFFTGDDLQNDKRVGVSYATDDLGKELVSRLTESW